MSNKFTVIIAFRNEGDEVTNTISSILEKAHYSPEIILVNDNSDDNYDYESVAKRFNCRYIELYQAIGPARARNVGVHACRTEFFILMDAHMRIYDNSWDDIIMSILPANPHSIIGAATINTADLDPKIKKPKITGGEYGAYVNFAPGEEYTLKWASQAPVLDDAPENLQPIISVLGAFYATSKTHWHAIGGLDGLDGYGFEETWLSLKTWLSGGHCYNLKDFATGHLYRKTPPTKINSEKYYANQLLMIHFFTEKPEDIKTYEKNLSQKIGEEMFNKSQKIFQENFNKLANFYQTFHQNQKMSMADFLTMNNEVCAK